MDKKANCRPASSDSGDTQSSLDVETPTIPSKDPKTNRNANVSASTPQLLFECNPGQTASIIKRKAMIKELSALYHAECLSYSQKVLDLQRKWEQGK